MSFVVVRHSETGGLGTIPVGALEYQEANGWVRVSEDEREWPSDFHLPDYEPKPEEPITPAEPDEGEEQQ